MVSLPLVLSSNRIKGLHGESGGDAPSNVSVAVGVDAAIRVHIQEVVGVASIRRTLPPTRVGVSGGTRSRIPSSFPTSKSGVARC